MLSTKQLQDIEKLQKECAAYDYIQLKLNWEMLRNRESDQLDFLHYENDELIAFLGLYPFGSTVEVCGMVKPRERRKGHFSRLFQLGMVSAKENSFKRILLNAPASSTAANAFLAKQGATYGFSEHQMQWQERILEEVDGFTLRQATKADSDMRVRLSMEAFGLTEEDARATESRINGDVDNIMYMIDVNEGTIGNIRIKQENGEAWIYGFAILLEYQGKGIGRIVLQKVVKEQSASGHTVHLEVETKNTHALGLYESIGFIVVHAQDYYIYD
ncbi:GNAT family N-acetyltransferase [Psychrobacillus soli]|uniref:GNAT family N-acetyltransferase n=1 Tax=Psychrobacillus soli TaxID=1543965 RepID=A0A544TM53_9BACI|nr:GNAT family N-acetyltransferase [Psychrobacillus soli]TQR18480.1 GNAT family N-acetyltransferase [Psychrobacillus soli]